MKLFTMTVEIALFGKTTRTVLTAPRPLVLMDGRNMRLEVGTLTEGLEAFRAAVGANASVNSLDMLIKMTALRETMLTSLTLIASLRLDLLFMGTPDVAL